MRILQTHKKLQPKPDRDLESQAREMTHAKALTTKPDKRGSIPGTHTAAGENQVLQAALQLLHMHYCMRMHMRTYTHKTLKIERCNKVSWGTKWEET